MSCILQVQFMAFLNIHVATNPIPLFESSRIYYLVSRLSIYPSCTRTSCPAAQLHNQRQMPTIQFAGCAGSGVLMATCPALRQS